MKRRSVRLILISMTLLYLFVVFRGHQKQHELLLLTGHRNEEQKSVSTSVTMVGKTKVVAFCNYNYRSLAIEWFRRMGRLGYKTHTIVATDFRMVEFLRTHNENGDDQSVVRYEVMVHEPLPDKYLNKPPTKRDHLVLELLMAVRRKYLLQQLQLGIHVLLTDVDNVFTKYYDPLYDTNSSRVDVLHAYATKYPRRTYGAQGFVVCSGMSWWRATSASLEYAQLMHQACGQMCDDQRVLNVLMEQQLQMKWNIDPSDFSLKTRISNNTESDPRLIGLMTQSIHGTSNRIKGLTVKVWDRDFAFRGPLYPEPACPKSVWVSMPILDAPSRGKAWLTKIESFKQWDKYCASRA